MLIEAERRSGFKPQLDVVGVMGVSLHDVELFFIREGTLVLLALTVIQVFTWFRPRAVPDRDRHHVERSRLWTPVAIGMLLLGAAALPLTNTVTSLKPQTISKPRYIDREKRQRRKSRRSQRAAWVAERAAVEALRRNPEQAAAQFDVLLAVLRQDSANVRLFDYLAHLTVVHNLRSRRQRLVEYARSLTTRQSKNAAAAVPHARPGFAPARLSLAPRFLRSRCCRRSCSDANDEAFRRGASKRRSAQHVVARANGSLALPGRLRDSRICCWPGCVVGKRPPASGIASGAVAESDGKRVGDCRRPLDSEPESQYAYLRP